MITSEKVRERLKTVMDPEVDMDIVTMGLIYGIEVVDEKTVRIVMTLTTPFCPLGPQIMGDMRSAVLPMGFDNVDIELTFDPPWKPPEGLRISMGL